MAWGLDDPQTLPYTLPLLIKQREPKGDGGGGGYGGGGRLGSEKEDENNFHRETGLCFHIVLNLQNSLFDAIYLPRSTSWRRCLRRGNTSTQRREAS